MDYINTVGAANLVLGVVLPFVVALVTARLASSKVKALVLLVLALAAASITTAVGDGAFTWQEVVNDAVVIWPTAILTHYGLWKPTGGTGTDGVVQTAVPGGLGAPKEEVVPVEEEFVEVPAPEGDAVYEDVAANEGEGEGV